MSQSGQVGGFARCPKCGATEITYSQRAGMLMCQFCRATWQEASAEQALGFDGDIGSLTGARVSQGASQIDRDAGTVVTLKCQGCGAEVVIDSATNVQARCHWCRSFLSLDSRVPNGAVPDAVLPFSVPHDQAVALIREFAGKRMGFAQRAFKREFTPENVVGVYMPYFVADVNAEVAMQGEGEIETRRYTVRRDDRSETRYDADVYQVTRQFSMTLDDLILESSARRAGHGDTHAQETSNIVNAVLPFDTKNAVQYNANYLGRFTSEKRDLDVGQVGGSLTRMVFGAGTAQVRSTLGAYGRGVRWDRGAVGIKGVRYLSMYAPIWLYSHYERGGNGSEYLHYIAVNGRTGAVMGSVPVDKTKLTMASLGIFVATFIPVIGALLWVF